MYASTNEFNPVPDIEAQRRCCQWPLLASDKYFDKAVREGRMTDDERPFRAI